MMYHDMESLPQKVYRLHCSGKAVSKIAKQLSLCEDDVRGYITAQWYEDKQAAKMEALRAFGGPKNGV